MSTEVMVGENNDKGESIEKVREKDHIKRMQYLKYYGVNYHTPRNDYDILKHNYRFIEQDASSDCDDDYGRNFAKEYYDNLVKTFCVADLSRYREGKVGMRWRTHSEVVDGKGQFVCGAIRCEEKDQLRSMEVSFKYREDHQTKQALVKLRVCPSCALKVNYKKEKEKDKREKKEKKRKSKRSRRKRHRSDSSDSPRDRKKRKKSRNE
eukprot:TRINITY_DN4434_c0_g1_i1.p1 TRINITY_DN4434_c0_g1~~TRINITY_DN4434_c0_g1_i1.p1  ORF type:complete len:208 (+),score=45.09 TRINITY_DN4434_c0_g1_i1:56-679(+)